MMTRITLQRLTKQSVTATFRANQLRDVDVASQMRMKQGVEAQERIYEGARSIWVSVVALLHCDIPESLAEACQKLTNAFHQGDFIQETEIAWQQMPTLADFIDTVAHLDLEVESDLLNEAIATILLELRGWLSSRVGKAISQPSTIRTDARLIVFALRNVGDNIEAAVLALSAQSIAFRRALEVSDSLLAIDESPILFKYNGIAQIA